MLVSWRARPARDQTTNRSDGTSIRLKANPVPLGNLTLSILNAEITSANGATCSQPSSDNQLAPRSCGMFQNGCRKLFALAIFDPYNLLVIKQKMRLRLSSSGIRTILGWTRKRSIDCERSTGTVTLPIGNTKYGRTMRCTRSPACACF